MIPVATLVFSVIGGAFLFKYEILARTKLSMADLYLYRNWTEIMLCTEMSITWLVTGLIAWRLYWAGHRTAAISDSGSSKYLSIILGIIESGTIFSIVNGVFVALFFIDAVSSPMVVRLCR